MTSLAQAARPSAGWDSTLAGLFGRVSDWNDARLTRRMLRRLSSQQLDDIGLIRGDIDAIAARGRR